MSEAPGSAPPAGSSSATQTDSSAVNAVSIGTLKIDIEKLTGADNYVTWRDDMTVYLRHLHVLNIVKGTVEAPKDSNSADYIAWEDKDTTAQLALMSCVTKDWKHLISQSATSAQGWKKLQDQFDRHNVVSIHHLLSKVVTLKMESTETSPQYLVRFDQTWTRLKNRV